MNAPNLWQQLLIAFIAIVSLPAVITLLIKLRVFPLVALWLIVDSFEEWALANETLCLWLFVAFVAYPVLSWGLRWKALLVCTAVPHTTSETA